MTAAQREYMVTRITVWRVVADDAEEAEGLVRGYAVHGDFGSATCYLWDRSMLGQAWVDDDEEAMG